AAEALRAWGPDAVGPLLGVMKDKDHPLAGGLALQALINMGPQAKAAVPALIRDMKAGNEATRNASIRVLHAIGPDAIPALLEAMKDRDNDYAWLALGQMGPKAKPAVADLAK